MDLSIPYLEEIGHKLIGENETDYGLFDIFRPALMARFEEKPAESNISYEYEGTSGFYNEEYGDPGKRRIEDVEKTDTAVPENGKFYYPWLGGVEEAKQCISTVLLQPGVTLDQVRASRFCPTVQSSIDEDYQGDQGPYF